MKPAGRQTPSRAVGRSAIALDNAGGVWAINTHNNSLYYGMSIAKIATNGTPAPGSPSDGGDLNIPYSLAVDGSGNVWVANTYAFEPSGPYISVIELKPSGSEAMSISYAGGLNQNMGSPQAIALDSAGDVRMANQREQALEQSLRKRQARARSSQRNIGASSFGWCCRGTGAGAGRSLCWGFDPMQFGTLCGSRSITPTEPFALCRRRSTRERSSGWLWWDWNGERYAVTSELSMAKVSRPLGSRFGSAQRRA